MTLGPVVIAIGVGVALFVSLLLGVIVAGVGAVMWFVDQQPPRAASSDAAQQLLRLTDLHDRGALTDEEYEQRRERLVRQLE